MSEATKQPDAPQFASDWLRIEHQDTQDRQRAEMALSDLADQDGSLEPTLRLINEHLDRMPEEARERYEGGTLANGTRALNDPATLRALAAEALAQVPDVLGELTERYNGNEMAAIESMMSDRNSHYWKGPSSELLQHRYRAHIQEREQIEQRVTSHPDFESNFAYAKANAHVPGFKDKAIERMIASGMTPSEAHYVADVYEQKLKET